jgi:hypothetical protein
MDLANNRLALKFTLRPVWNNIVANFLPARGYICVMVTGVTGVRVKSG